MSRSSRRPAPPERRFDPEAGIDRLGELVRLTAAPAGRSEICEQGLAVTAGALGAEGGAFFLKEGAGLVSAASLGKADPAELASAARFAVERVEPLAAWPDEGNAPSRVALLLPGDVEPLGVLVLDRPAAWSDTARAFVRSAVRVLAGALRAARATVESRDQRELLARRNLELDILRDLALRLQDFLEDEEILQAALELLLEKLDLRAGWIFWGEKARGKLELAAACGVSERFVASARTEGIGVCLCQDVFDTGRLAFARNTVDCPRLPGLLGGDPTMTHACIPLKFERGVLGVMNLCNRPGQTFAARELQFLEAAGKQVCLAVDKARSARAERRRNAEAQALATLARAIGGSLDSRQIVEAVGAYARDLLGAHRCAIFLGGGGSAYRFAHLAGPAFSRIRPGDGSGPDALGFRAVDEVLRAGIAFTVEDTAFDPRVAAADAAAEEIGSALLVPMRAHDEAVGVLVATRRRNGAWSLDQVELADALGRQAALAIDNARLYRDAQQSLDALQKAQEGMMRNERLAAIGTLAAQLAHEVRNPLNSINLQLVLLTRRLAKLSDADRREMGALVDTARREIVRLDGLVQESLSLSSVDRLARQQGNPEDVVREVLVLMAPYAKERGVDVIEDLGGLRTAVSLDREKFKQVLINLVRNAIEAMPGGGSLRVATTLESGSVVVRVADTGPGIPGDVDVFDLFVTTKDDGTGLGLPIAKRIVEAHGGSLSYESRPGEGTTFTVALKVS